MKKRKGFTPLEIKASNGVSKRFLTGFTLIELLVVISIIALLVSILTPALSKAKKSAQASMCLSNQHQFGLLWKFYTDEHSGFFPERGSSGDSTWPDSGDAPSGVNGWQYELEPYYGNVDILLCPAATKPYDEGGKPPYASWTDQTSVYHGSYCVNLWVANGGDGGDFDTNCWRTPYTKSSAYAPLLSDGNWKDSEIYHYDPPPDYKDYWWEENKNEIKRVAVNRHMEHVNISYLDFHSRKVGLKELWETWWHKDWNPNNDPPPDFCTPTTTYDGWMCHMKDYFGV